MAALSVESHFLISERTQTIKMGRIEAKAAQERLQAYIEKHHNIPLKGKEAK